MSAVNTAGYYVCKYTYIKGSKVLGVFSLFPPSVLSSNRQRMRRLKCFKRKQSVTEWCDSTLRQWHLQMTDGEKAYKHMIIIIPLAGEKQRCCGVVGGACLSMSSARLLFLCWPDGIRSLIDPEGMSRWWKCFTHPCATAQRLQDRWKQDLWRGRGSRVVFDEGDGCQLFAELLQHDHPLQKRHVVDATATKVAVRSVVKTAA